MVLLEFSMTPSTREDSKSKYVARILGIIDKSGLPYPRWPLKVLHLWPVKLLHPGHRKLMC